MKISINQLTQYLKENKLPGEKAWLKMNSRLSREDFYPKNSHYRNASVLICLIPKENDYQIPLIQRPQEKGPHSKQISFPGGAYENQDKTLERTALRESREEIGLPIDNIQILGKLTPLYIPVSGFLVHPFIGYLSYLPEFQLDPKEVEEVFLVSIEELLNPENQKVQTIYEKKFTIQVPAFYIQKKIVWGATAMILNEFLEVIKNI